MTENTKIICAMIDYFKYDPKRINHFMKVYGFASVIADKEKLNEETKRIVEIASVVHDIGIKKSEEKYNCSSGKYQQIEGPPEAKKLLRKLDIDEDIINRCCWLIAHHHTYTNIQEMDHQILVEADFLVNVYEDKLPKESIDSIMKKIFRTKTGIELTKALFIS